ncbi:Hypothetical predicted protein [Xyrichtys novacula]|uniref:Uncharacterized protein n=1 Tax=Xyrichtys novacula TaxID=13765 RepID=A0AAV1HIW0_XYRNO|nr:Hypothetical predicted protein [Xyrichtys novacula]
MEESATESSGPETFARRTQNRSTSGAGPAGRLPVDFLCAALNTGHLWTPRSPREQLVVYSVFRPAGICHHELIRGRSPLSSHPDRPLNLHHSSEEANKTEKQNVRDEGEKKELIQGQAGYEYSEFDLQHALADAHPRTPSANRLVRCQPFDQ